MMRPAPARTSRLDRLVVSQAHCSALELAAAVLLAVAAQRLTRVPAADDGWRVPLLLAAGLSAVAAVGPWLLARFQVFLQRALVWGGLVVASVGAVGATWEIDVRAYLALQLLLAAAVLAELGTRRRAIWWFWITASALVAGFALYYLLVDVQPRPE